WRLYFLNLSTPLFLILITYAAGIGLELAVRREKRMTSEEFSVWIARTPVIIISMSNTYIIIQLVKPFMCARSSGTLVLYDRPDLKCYDAEWFQNLPSVLLF